VSPADGCVGGSGALSRVRVRLRSETEKEGGSGEELSSGVRWSSRQCDAAVGLIVVS
jgi:hypothetical protein